MSLRYPKNKGRPINKIKKRPIYSDYAYEESKRPMHRNEYTKPYIILNTSGRDKKKLGEKVNQKLLYRESDWWYVGLVVQKARKQGTVC